MSVLADKHAGSVAQLELEAILKKPYQDVCNICKGDGRISDKSSCPKCKGSGRRYLKLL